MKKLISGITVSSILLFLICCGNFPILATNPSDGQTGVAVGSSVSAVLGPAVNKTSINYSTFLLKRADCVIPGLVSCLNGTATFDPAVELSHGTPYTALINARGADSPYSWSFTTEDLKVDDIPVEGQTIVVYGDTRTNHLAHLSVVSAIMKVSPVAVFHTGDLVEDGGDPEQWEMFNFITAGLREKAAFYPALGNHENSSQNFFDSFTLPGNERWYSVDYSGIHFIILDSNAPLASGAEQFEWLEADLAGVPPDTAFTVVIDHHPLFSTGPHGDDEAGIRDSLLPLFKERGVDVVFSGHDHDYERSFYDGIHYIVAGGGGAPLRAKKRASPFSEKFLSEFHFCKVVRSGDDLVVSVYNPDMRLLDAFKISR